MMLPERTRRRGHPDDVDAPSDHTERGRIMLALVCIELESFRRQRALKVLEAAGACFERARRDDLVADCLSAQAELLCLLGDERGALTRFELAGAAAQKASLPDLVARCAACVTGLENEIRHPIADVSAVRGRS